MTKNYSIHSVWYIIQPEPQLITYLKCTAVPQITIKNLIHELLCKFNIYTSSYSDIARMQI